MKKNFMDVDPCIAIANSSPLLTICTRVSFSLRRLHSIFNEKYNTDFNNKVPSVTLDRHFVGVKYSYFEEFNVWYKETTNGINNKQNNESFDCDNHAMLYKSLFSISTLKKDVKREILVGVILVEQSEHFLEYLQLIVTHSM